MNFNHVTQMLHFNFYTTISIMLQLCTSKFELIVEFANFYKE